MAKIAPYIFLQEFDDNGEPLSGGKLHTYEAGTATPKVTYTTSDESIANANPIILDASGRADVWLESGAYKFVLNDANDVLIKEVDNVSGDTINAFGGQVFDVSTNTNITTAYQNSLVVATGTITLSLLDASTAGEGFVVSIRNSGSGTVTIDPDGSETINGASTLALTQDEWAIVICDGANWRALDYQDPTLGTIATQDADNVSITGGSITGITDLAIADGGTGAGTAAAAFTNLKQNATTSATGVVELATAAEVESETASKVPTADILYNHPGIAKAACKADGTGTPSFDWEYNFNTITSPATGQYDFTMDVTFASADDYAVVALGETLSYARVENKTTTGFRIIFQATGISGTDMADINIAVFGNLA
jgi:hypothetical protein